MKCQACVDFILRYLEDDLAAEERESFEFHLAKCPPCRRYLDQYRFTVKAGKTACGEQAAAKPVPEELIAAILASRKDTSA